MGFHNKLKEKSGLRANTPTLKFGERGGVRVGKNKFRLQYPGCGVLSSELWRTITNLFLGMIVALSRPGMRFNLGHKDELASLTLFNSVKSSGHPWRFLILYGLQGILNVSIGITTIVTYW